jgi:hypothetical protein
MVTSMRQRNRRNAVSAEAAMPLNQLFRMAISFGEVGPGSVCTNA